MESSHFSPPRLPWEVIEMVIDHSRGRPKTLQSFALTCRQLLPRTRLGIFASVRFKSRKHVFAFVDFLNNNSHFKPVVRSIVVWPPDLAPVPLLHILPNLSEIKFTSLQFFQSIPELGIHQSSLICFQRLGIHIRTLHLSGLQFNSLSSFVRILSAFTSITHLLCRHVEIVENSQSNGEPPSLSETIIRQLSKRVKLEALTVDYHSLIKNKQATNFGRLLLEPSNPAPLTIESFTLGWGHMRVIVPLAEFIDKYRSDWSSLRFLSLQLSDTEMLNLNRLCNNELVPFLEAIRSKSPLLMDVTLEWQLKTIRDLCADLGPEIYKKLECALLAFSRPKIIWAFASPLATNCGSFWLDELKKYLPILSNQHGAVTLCSRCEDVLAAGHDSRVHALNISQDSKWVASGSEDSTIILWNVDNGKIAHRWVAHSYRNVLTLAFSPDSRYLVSGGIDTNIWDFSRGICKVATLEGHASATWKCAWSPDGKNVATGSEDGIVRLWDAHLFRKRAFYQLRGEIDCLLFSPNGRWLACISTQHECSILNVALGTLHASFPCRPDSYNLSDDPHTPRPVLPYAIQVASAAFHPESTRLAIAPHGRAPTINVIDIETGDASFPWDGEGEEHATDISFSPDGQLVLGVVGTTCCIWAASTGTAVSQLTGHERPVTTARFSPCGTYAASASWDGTARLWRTSDGTCCAALSERSAIYHIAFSPDGKTLSLAGDGGMVVIRHMRDIVDLRWDGAPLITPSPSSIVKSTISDDGPKPSMEQEADPDEPSPVAEHEERATMGSPTAGPTAPEGEPIGGDGGLPTSSARPSSIAATESETLMDQGRAPPREIQEDANAAGQARATPTAEPEENVDGSAASITGPWMDQDKERKRRGPPSRSASPRPARRSRMT